ncbi:MAG TPA: hypothetical protein VK535_12795 [Gemmatimonadales bacterium]|nr:hypothetical protein [Gemmatimonadales bacterium]
MSARLNRRGSTLPLSLLVIALLGFSVAVAYARLSSERRITGDAQAQVNAFAVAQSGLSRYLASVTALPGAAANVTYNDLPGGTAQVNLARIRDSVVTTKLFPAVYVITSRGTNTTAKRYGAGAAPAERTVATYAIWTPTPFDINGAFTSLGAVRVNGNSFEFSGIDRCGGAPTVAGLAVPNGDISQIPFANNLNGNPDNTASDLGTPLAGGTAKDEVDMDWPAIVAGTAFPANYVYPSWPATFDAWPVVRVNGDLADLPASGGKGILIVTGNMTWNGSPERTWEGLILVGGTLTANGNGHIFGALVTGLNVKTGGVVGLNDLGNGNKEYKYDSCALSRALGQIGSLERVRNGWTDTWASY